MHRLGSHVASEMRREQFDKVVSISAQIFILAHGDAGGVGFEQVFGFYHAQMTVAIGNEGELREDAYA